MSDFTLTQRDALSAAQGMDTHDLLNHIAWTDVIKPQLLAAKSILTQRLVDATLSPQKEGSETREQLAGKLFGINFIENTLEKILRDGDRSKAALANQNLFIQ